VTSAWERLRQLGADPRPAGTVAERQAAWLMALVAHNQGTAYGKEYGFQDMHSVEAYRQRVPVIDYEDLAPWITRVAAGEADVLFAGRPVAFEITGGSRRGGKLIPYTIASLSGFQSALLPWLSRTIARHGLDGSAYWSISPATRRPRSTPGGTAIGLPDGAYLGSEAAPLLSQVSAVPPWVGELADVDAWRLATWHGLARHADLELISVWSPTFLLSLLDAWDTGVSALREALRHGADLGDRHLPPDAAALARVDAYAGRRDARLLWPRLKLVSCWADASSRPYFEELRARLPHAAYEAKGLLATEGVITAVDARGRPVLAADSGFFEFRDAHGALHLAHQLQAGERYEVVMTTAGGLYRYRIGDHVVCEETAGGLPVLRFTGRCDLISDLVGEKLTEEFVADCLEGIEGFRVLVPAMSHPPGYTLVLDRARGTRRAGLIEHVEQRLARNPQYAYARRMGQLQCLTLMFAHTPLEVYSRLAIAKGARLGDIKVPALRPEPEWAAAFSGSDACA
jgi:hypothetical protein